MRAPSLLGGCPIECYDIWKHAPSRPSVARPARRGHWRYLVQLEELRPGVRVSGLIPGEVVTVVFAQPHGQDAFELTFKKADGSLAQQNVYREHESALSLGQSDTRPFDADAADFKMVAEAQRIRLAGLFDPMLAVATSDVQPLPHQIRAVYGSMIQQTPMRFLLADDPGAGKTIMAGLYIKELMLRDDVHRALIVAPGGLVEQWQDELFFKFGLRFTLLTNDLINSATNTNVFEDHPLLIARMDQLSRNEELRTLLAESEWDLIVVDEAHRMGAHYFGGKTNKTQRFLLGELLGSITRHFLLMTATPHSGKEENFQLFLTLLDKDRFEGKQKRAVDTDGIMLRRVKEDLRTFEGRRLFPERIAETVPYELTALENDLYEQVTEYVREGMNRADKLDGKRRNNVGFALTVLQRRLASSPEAIYQSLVRRSERLTKRMADIQSGKGVEPEPNIDVNLFDEDDLTAEETENLEEELLDSATAALTVEELAKELADLEVLIKAAKVVRDAGTDRKWAELSKILQDNTLVYGDDGKPRKLIVFTEHRDTLNYLLARTRTLIGKHDAVKAIHGGVNRKERRAITEEFTKNPNVQVLIATDAAGEGLNLQAAHLMVNYDLPWNPNRIEQRFGRVHRIGQLEVCRLWNLVAANTREGEVFVTLLAKIEEMRKAYGGKVFDVLGDAFTDTSLRDLLKEAIRYGEQPEVRAKMREVIDAAAGVGIKELLDERALASNHLTEADLYQLRAAMDEARARRLQPHYIELAFKAAFRRLGGRMSPREKGRYEISNVPAALRMDKRIPIATRYSRVTFEPERIAPDDLPGDHVERADLLAPGHPLHDAVMAEVVRRYGSVLDSGTILVSAELEQPQLLVGVIEEVTDATDEVISRRFRYVYVDENGQTTPAGPAPYLDCVAAPEDYQLGDLPWLDDAENKVKSWIIASDLPQYLEEVKTRRELEVAKTRSLVKARLENERDRLALDATVAFEDTRAGKKPRESAESLNRKAVELDARLSQRLAKLDRQATLSTKPPVIATVALVLPLAMVDSPASEGKPAATARETEQVERRGVELVMAKERELGRLPVEQDKFDDTGKCIYRNPGFDILSTDPITGDTYRIEVKSRIKGADNFSVSHNEVMTGKNAAPRYRLAIVRVDQRGAEHDEVRYLDNPFEKTDLGSLDATGIHINWPKTWAKGQPPF